MPGRPVSARALLLSGIGLLALAAGLLTVDLVSLRTQTRAAERYRQVEGTVLAAEILEHHQRGSADTWSPKVRYRYTVAGRSHDNDAHAFVRSASAQRETVQQFLDAHPIGGPIRVFYDPEDPARSVLSLARTTGAGLWFPVLPAAFGVLAMVMAFRRRRPVPPVAWPAN